MTKDMETLSHILNSVRGVRVDLEATRSPLGDIEDAIRHLQEKSCPQEAGVLSEVLAKCTGPKNFGGLGLDEHVDLSEAEQREVLFLCEAWLESLNATERQKQRATPLRGRPAGRRGMTLTEKLFAMHDVQPQGSVRPGQVIRVAVDWIMASELSWGGMKKTYDQLGQPGIFRNDRFWLAGDHIVDPRVNHKEHVKQAIEESEEAKTTFKMTEYQGLNYTIMHTEFFRERAEPGMLVIGSDSHTCSGGAASALAIGLGAPDVTMALVITSNPQRSNTEANIAAGHRTNMVQSTRDCLDTIRWRTAPGDWR